MTDESQPEPAPAAVPDARGDFIISLEGVDFPLRPSFAAIAEIEAGTGQPLIDLARAAERAALPAADVGTIIAACIRAHALAMGDRDLAAIKPKRAGELAYAETGGVLVVQRVTLAPLLMHALTGGFTPAGERKP